MSPFDFLRKNKKAWLAAIGLIPVCVIIALLVWAVRRDAAEQSHGEIMENGILTPSTKPQTEQASEQGTEPTSEPKDETQEESAEESETTSEPEPVLTEEYELIYEGINVFVPDTTDSYFTYEDVHADLYMRRLQEDTEEYIELSLWSDQKEIWHTGNRDHITGDFAGYLPSWQEDYSAHLTLDERLCYYVVESDGMVYLMRYCVETESDIATMSYMVFGISTDIDSPYSFCSEEIPLDAGSISFYLVSNGVVDPAVSFPIEEMTAFAETVKGYMENGQLAASTLHGVFESGDSVDGDNPVSPYLYDIFPWISEMVTQYSIDTEDLHSPKMLLQALQNALPADTSVIMPDVVPDGNGFITGEYYSGSDESFLTVRMMEDGSYGGTLLIENALNADFAGYYDNGILTFTQTDNYPDETPCEMEISFQNGKATVTITAAKKWSFVKVGDTFILDRGEKPKVFENLKNAEYRTLAKAANEKPLSVSVLKIL